jgi:hypothetical protein
VKLNFRLDFVYLLCIFFLFKILYIFIVFVYDICGSGRDYPFYINSYGKMVSVFKQIGFRTAFRNELCSTTDVPLYLHGSLEYYTRLYGVKQSSSA